MFTVIRLALTWNFPYGQVSIGLKFSQWTGLHQLQTYPTDRLALTRICTMDSMALTWNLSFGQVRIDLELMLRTE